MDFVRGDKDSEYHKDIKNKFITELEKAGLSEYQDKVDIRCVGGG
jgi:hypothetical protein